MEQTEQHVERATTARREMPKRRHHGDAAKVYNKSKVGNGKTLLPTASGSSIWARLTKDTMRSLISHCGGADLISETQKLAARRVSVLEAELIFLEDKFGLARQHGDEPNPSDVQLYGQLADRQRRLSDPLGWSRTAREIELIGALMREVTMAPPQGAEDGSVFEMAPVEKDAPATAAEAPDAPQNGAEGSDVS